MVWHGIDCKDRSTSIREQPDYEFVMSARHALRDNPRLKILVIEDAPKLAEYLRKALTESSYVVDVAHGGIDGRHLALDGQYDLVLLDVMLPGLDGFTVLRELRRENNVPVLMLTARGKVEDRVKGLQAGADDYLVKPFALSCSPAYRRCYDASPFRRQARIPQCLNWPTSNSIWSGARPRAPDSDAT